MTDIQHLPKPENLDRVESGVVQFGDDWPGVFIRGDNALTFAHMLRETLAIIPQTEWLVRTHHRALAQLLQECSVGNTGWPPFATPATEHAAIRDGWLKHFDARKRALIESGMSTEDADAQAAREVISELRGE